jgi:Tfp pilus assembly protein PilF
LGRRWAPAALLLFLALAAYHRVWDAGFIWDDDAHVTPAGLAALHGLWRIWAQPGATQQYYPVLYTFFWIEHRLWGDAAAGYHLANITLHAASALLLFRLLRRLAVPGALLAAALFVVHPVCAESVAWVSEEKNTLSTVFMLASALAFLRFSQSRRPSWYALGSFRFALALLTKSVTATLPAALLVVLWWRNGRISWRRDVVPLLPWFAASVGFGSFSAWFERTHVGASGAAFQLGAAGRILVAGRALWFYLGKLLWPVHLAFIYPRWAIDPAQALQWLWPAAAAAAILLGWALRRRSRGPLACALLFAGVLFPALGFVNVFPFLYSFVADHFQYLGALVMLSSLAAAAAIAAGRLAPRTRQLARAAAVVLVALLGAATYSLSAEYGSSDALWRETILRNPSAWIAENNLASAELEEGRVAAAEAHARAAVRLAPRDAEAHLTLGEVLLRERDMREAGAQFGMALELEPANAIVNNNIGNLFLQAGRLDDAIGRYRVALQSVPGFAKARANLGQALLRANRPDEAEAELRRALDDDPSDALTESNLGVVLVRKGLLPEATLHFERAARLNPRWAGAQLNLGNALMAQGRHAEAAAHFRAGLEIDPGNAQLKASLEAALSGK